MAPLDPIARVNWLTKHYGLEKAQWAPTFNGHFMDVSKLKAPFGQGYDSKRFAEQFWFSINTGLRWSLLGLKDGETECLLHDTRELSCCNCDEPVAFMLDIEKKTAVAQSVCQFSNGLPEYSVELDVPSGKLVFANDFRTFFGGMRGEPRERGPRGSVNYVAGQCAVAEHYASKGMFHITVGNTSPGIYKSGNTITMASRREGVKAKADEKDFGRKCGSICTDLWWYSAADYDKLKECVEAMLAAKPSKESRTDDSDDDDDVRLSIKTFQDVLDRDDTTVVKVKPGRYRATGRRHLADRDDEGDQYYAEMFDVEDALIGRDRHDRSKTVPAATGDEERRLTARLKELKKAIHDCFHSRAFTVYSVITRIGDC